MAHSTRSITPDYYTAAEDGDERHFQRMLRWYHHRFRDCPAGASLLFPIGVGGWVFAPLRVCLSCVAGRHPHRPFNSPLTTTYTMQRQALRALRRLTALSGGRALVISGDKGNNNAEQFKGLIDPHIAVHGSFSVMVGSHGGRGIGGLTDWLTDLHAPAVVCGGCSSCMGRMAITTTHHHPDAIYTYICIYIYR